MTLTSYQAKAPNKLINISRWVVLLPGSIILAALCSLVFIVLALIGDLLDGSLLLGLKNPELLWSEYWFTPFITWGVFGGCVIYFAHCISPNHKNTTSLVALIILTVVLGILSTVSILTMPHNWELWRLLLSFLTSIIVATVVHCNLKK